MTDLATWLLEQIAEDKRVARRASPSPWSSSHGVYGDEEWIDLQAADKATVIETESGANGPNAPTARHIARWQPGRVLAECDAKRRIIEGLAPDLQAASGAVPPDELGARLTTELKAVAILRLLALPYQDRPGFREEWRA